MVISNPIEIKYINITQRIVANNIFNDLETENKKLEIFSSSNGSIKLEIRCKDHLKTNMVIIGEMTDKNINNMPAVPTASALITLT